MIPARKDRQKEKRMLKDRDEAWNRVETLAMRHPNYKMIVKGTTNNPYTLPQHLDSPPPDEDGDNDQIPLTLEKIEAKANEVNISKRLHHRYSPFAESFSLFIVNSYAMEVRDAA